MRTRKLHIIWIAVVVLSFFLGYLTHKLYRGPKKYMLGMDVVYLKCLDKQYGFYVSYHDKGEIKDVYMKDMNTGECALEYTLYAKGYTRSYLKKTEENNILTVLDESGLPVLRKYLNNKGDTLKQEILEKDGSIKEVQDFTIKESPQAKGD